VPRSLEDRRSAVAAALRAVATEPLPEPEPSVVEAVVDAVDARLDELSVRIDEVLSRLDSVETTLLESAWERSAPEPQELDEPDSTVSVPAVSLGEGRMSSGAAKALFGH
jgi:hypothetical protein